MVFSSVKTALSYSSGWDTETHLVSPPEGMCGWLSQAMRSRLKHLSDSLGIPLGEKGSSPRLSVFEKREQNKW